MTLASRRRRPMRGTGRSMAARRGPRPALLAAVLFAGLAGCAGSDRAPDAEAGAAGRAVADPYEPLNREIHGFNKAVDRRALRPAAQAYRAATPGLVKFLLGNALHHLELPRDFANHLLSGEVAAAGRAVARFSVNTVFGAGGLLDPATEFELPKEDADFGKTLAAWGMEEGIYYEIPFIGPSTVRRTIGRSVDLALSPTAYFPPLFAFSALPETMTLLDARASNLSAADSVLYDSLDSYATTRSVYLQNRRAFVNGQGEAATPDLVDIFDEE